MKIESGKILYRVDHVGDGVKDFTLLYDGEPIGIKMVLIRESRLFFSQGKPFVSLEQAVNYAGHEFIKGE